MGFATIATAAAAAAAAIPRVMESRAYRQESKNLARAADIQERMANEQSNNMVATALRNMRAESRNANDALSIAGADAGVSNLADEGSVPTRERDLATRLQDEINLHATSALQDANATRKQGAYEAWNTRLASQRARSMSRASLFSALGGGVGTSLSK